MTKIINLRKELNKYFDTGINTEKDRLPDIKLTKKEISVYDLTQYIEKEFNLKFKKEQLLESMKNYYSKKILKRLFIPSDGKIKYCCRIDIGVYNGVPEIRLYESMYTEIPTIRIFNTNKPDEVTSYTFGGDVGDYWLTSSKEDLLCIEAHLDQIKDIFKNREAYLTYEKNPDAFPQKINRILNQLQFSDEMFKVNFMYDYTKNKLIPNLYLKEEAIKKDLDEESPISEISKLVHEIQLKKDDILKRIPIRIPELSSEIQDIINRRRKEESLETLKQKTLTRKRTKSKRI